MNGAQQFVKCHTQSIEQQYQANSECWNLVVDDDLFQVDMCHNIWVIRCTWKVNNYVMTPRIK